MKSIRFLFMALLLVSFGVIQAQTTNSAKAKCDTKKACCKANAVDANAQKTSMKDCSKACLLTCPPNCCKKEGDATTSATATAVNGETQTEGNVEGKKCDPKKCCNGVKPPNCCKTQKSSNTACATAASQTASATKGCCKKAKGACKKKSGTTL